MRLADVAKTYRELVNCAPVPIVDAKPPPGAGFYALFTKDNDPPRTRRRLNGSPPAPPVSRTAATPRSWSKPARGDPPCPDPPNRRPPMRRRSGHPITAPTAATRDDAWPPIGTDATIVVALDGVLYHESDLDLEEHYTGTHGYTEIGFAAFGMVGMRFCPRIRSLHHQRIYCADPEPRPRRPQAGPQARPSGGELPPHHRPRARIAACNTPSFACSENRSVTLTAAAPAATRRARSPAPVRSCCSRVLLPDPVRNPPPARPMARAGVPEEALVERFPRWLGRCRRLLKRYHNRQHKYTKLTLKMLCCAPWQGRVEPARHGDRWPTQREPPRATPSCGRGFPRRTCTDCRHEGRLRFPFPGSLRRWPLPGSALTSSRALSFTRLAGLRNP